MSELSPYVSLRTAMEQTGSTDEAKFIRETKLKKCYFEKAGIIRIDVTELQRLIDQDFAAAQEQAAKRKATVRNAGSDYGLVEARLKLHPQRLADKKAKITDAEAKVKAADSPYQRRQAEKELQKLRTELVKLEEGQKRDQKRRDDFLNGDDSKAVAA